MLTALLAPGTQVGRCVVLDELGEGAMGEVYRAWDNALDRVVALKLLLPMRVGSEVARRRFDREARLSARINHPSVAHVYDVGEHEGAPFIAMEFVPGRQLRKEMTGPMAPGRVVPLLRQILAGLIEAHRQGVVHRDLKPENILIWGVDQVKILDFGLAKPLEEELGEVVDLKTTGLTGTPRYMAPEQIQGTKVDPRTDIYAVGTVAYEMITGKPAHQGHSLAEMLMAVVHRPTPDLTAEQCPPFLGRLVKRALQKAPEDRFPDANAMLDALETADAKALPPPLPTRRAHVPHPRALMYAQRGRQALTGISSSSSMAVDLLREAIDIDPDFALAHAMYAEAAAALFNTGHVDATWLDRAQRSLERAETLDPTLPDVRVARARIVWTKTFNFPAETALRELRWALRAEPEHVGALRLWATITGHVGLMEHARAAASKRLAAEPKDETMLGIVAALHMSDGEPARALESVRYFTEHDKHHEEPLFWWIRGHALALCGRVDEAEAAALGNLARMRADPLSLALLCLVRALQRRPKEAAALAAEAEACLKSELHPHHAYHLLACAESVLGRVPRAVDWLRRTANEGMPCYTWFENDPLLENLRADPLGRELMSTLERRFQYFAREFPLDDPATLSFIATVVSDDG